MGGAFNDEGESFYFFCGALQAPRESRGVWQECIYTFVDVLDDFHKFLDIYIVEWQL